jgi:hypothetical protein
VANRLDEVLRAAHRWVAECECGRETSCYRCLCNFRNQWRHDILRRGPVTDLLDRLLGSCAQDGFALVRTADLAEFDGRSYAPRSTGRTQVGTLWVETEGNTVVRALLDIGDEVLDLNR